MFQKLYTIAEKDMLFGQIEVIRRNKKIIQAFGPSFLRKIFRERFIPCCHGKEYEERFYTVKLRRDSSDELERKIYDKCIRWVENDIAQYSNFLIGQHKTINSVMEFLQLYEIG